MSVGNLDTQGQRKNNYPYQLKNLQGLKKISDSLSPPVTPDNAIATIIVRGVAGLLTESGTLSECRSISFANTGTVGMTVDTAVRDMGGRYGGGAVNRRVMAAGRHTTGGLQNSGVISDVVILVVRVVVSMTIGTATGSINGMQKGCAITVIPNFQSPIDT